MSNASDPKEAMVEEVREQTDVGDLLAGDDIEDQLDGESIGRTLGGSLGALAGRQFGRRIARKIRDRLPFVSDPDRELSLPGRVLRALVVAVGRTLSKPEFQEAFGDALEGIAERRERAREAAESAAETTEEAADQATDTAEGVADEATDAAEEVADQATEATEGAADAAEEAADAATETSADAVEALPDGLDDVKRDTYRELLDVLSYSDLQSVAKSVGVKANLGREEMTDAIVEEFSEEDGETGDEDTDDGNEE